MITRTILATGALLTLACFNSAFADDGDQSGTGVNLKQVTSNVDLHLSGWARVDYGYGDERYGEASGDDKFGISRMALITDATYENFDLVTVLGATVLSDDGDPETDDSDIDFRDIFINWNDFLNDGSLLRVGVQPILFGLKPEGWPGDRSIISSIEYGGAGAFAVSNQGGPAIVAHVPIVEETRIELGAFDTSESNAEFIDGTGLGDVDGSALYKNGFVQIRSDRLGTDGLYGVAGIEGRYVGEEVDSSKVIWDVGLGYRNDLFDLSTEYIWLDQDITETADDEAYVIVELTVTPIDRWSFMFDWGHADELEADTFRVGVRYDVNRHVWVHLEYAGDFLDDEVFGEDDEVNSGEARLGFAF